MPSVSTLISSYQCTCTLSVRIFKNKTQTKLHLKFAPLPWTALLIASSVWTMASNRIFADKLAILAQEVHLGNFQWEDKYNILWCSSWGNTSVRLNHVNLSYTWTRYWCWWFGACIYTWELLCSFTTTYFTRVEHLTDDGVPRMTPLFHDMGHHLMLSAFIPDPSKVKYPIPDKCEQSHLIMGLLPFDLEWGTLP